VNGEAGEKPAQSRYCIRAAVLALAGKWTAEHGSQVASPIAMSLTLA
jgi:hypothetical protein